MNKQQLAKHTIKKWQRIYNAIAMNFSSEYIQEMMGKQCAFCRENNRLYWKEGPCVSCQAKDLCKYGSTICHNYRNGNDVLYAIRMLISDLEEMSNGS